jgi:hypothetical protein
MSVEHPFEMTVCDICGRPRTNVCAKCGTHGCLDDAYYENLFEQGIRRVTTGPDTPRDSREQPMIPGDTGEDGRTNLHS